MIGHRTAQEVSNSTTDNRDDQGMSSSNFVGHDTKHEASDHQPHHEHLVNDDGPVVVSTNKIIFLSNCGNPINFDQTSIAFKKHMGGSLTKD